MFVRQKEKWLGWIGTTNPKSARSFQRFANSNTFFKLFSLFLLAGPGEMTILIHKYDDEAE